MSNVMLVYTCDLDYFDSWYILVNSPPHNFSDDGFTLLPLGCLFCNWVIWTSTWELTSPGMKMIVRIEKNQTLLRLKLFPMMEKQCPNTILHPLPSAFGSSTTISCNHNVGFVYLYLWVRLVEIGSLLFFSQLNH